MQLLSFREKMSGQGISKAEIALRIEVAMRGLHPDMSHDIVLRWTRPDQYYESTAGGHPLAVYLDTPATHKKPDRDEEITLMLEHRHIVVYRYIYRPPIPRLMVRNIDQEIQDYVRGKAKS